MIDVILTDNFFPCDRELLTLSLCEPPLESPFTPQNFDSKPSIEHTLRIISLSISIPPHPNNHPSGGFEGTTLLSPEVIREPTIHEALDDQVQHKRNEESKEYICAELF